MRIKSLIVLSLTYLSLSSQPFDSTLFNCMKWRMTGPFRGGRTVGASGVRQQPNVFYMGVNNGGVWKTIDYGRTWQPIFDDQSTGSIGDVAVAPSNPNVVYVGSGEGIQRPDLSVGNGMYKSIDAGKTWTKLGLNDGQQIGRLAIDPTNENRVFVAVLGHPYGPNAERGVYRTNNGGKTWEKVFYIDENTGAIQVEVDPVNPQIVYADMWAGRQGPWENGSWDGPNSGLFKSTDGGATWKKLTGGLPTTAQGLGRIGFCVAAANHNRLYATVDAKEEVGGIYRSDDGGENWTKLSGDNRLWGRGSDFAELRTDPKNADIVYDADVVVWKSTDGGKTWSGFRGAPGGDDSHRLWINPDNPDIILLAGDQGSIITVNGGKTWSSWYNQPTAQLYHVSADNDFPYNVYSGQQESGSVGNASRGNDGEITFREWHPVGAEEYGYVVADPLDPNIVYGGKISRYDKHTAQTQDISPEAVRSGKYRFIRTAPIVFSSIDPHVMFYAGNVIFKTRNGGNSWQIISPDLTRKTWDVPASVGVYRTDDMKTMPQRGVIYTLAPSPVDSNTIWAGTDDGLIQVTHDGGNSWTNVTPPEITSWSKVSMMDASHTDVNTAYAAVNRIRCDDMHPHIYRTTDGGKTWKEIVTGLPNDPVNTVKEDPIRKGLLFAGTETAVHVSFDDGEHWQSLRLNMPATSIRDLVIKDNDLAIATHGRSFWILDDMSPLRELTTASATTKVILYKPAPAYRVRWDMNTDTPLPQEEPAGENPPDGAIIDYYLSEPVSTEVTLDILNADNKVIRHYSSRDTLYKVGDVNIPLYWIRPQQIPSSGAGVHRFIWDLHYQPLNVPPSYPIAAVYNNTAPDPTSPWVMPGTYTVRLTVNGVNYSAPVTIKMDPRVTTPVSALQQQHDLSLTCYNNKQKVMGALQSINFLQLQIKEHLSQSKQPVKDSLQKFSDELALLQTSPKGSNAPNLNSINEACSAVFNVLQNADVLPTQQCIEAANTTNHSFDELWVKWVQNKAEAKKINKLLKKSGAKVLQVSEN